MGRGSTVVQGTRGVKRAVERARVFFASAPLPHAARCPTRTQVDPPRGDADRAARADKRSLFERLVEFISPGPDSQDELIETLADAEQRELIEPESRMMLEGVIRMADMTAGDVMVAAPRMDLLDIDAPYDELLRRRDRHRATRASRSTRASATTSSAS